LGPNSAVVSTVISHVSSELICKENILQGRVLPRDSLGFGILFPIPGDSDLQILGADCRLVILEMAMTGNLQLSFSVEVDPISGLDLISCV
jgi:hypothetical protein